MVPLLHPKASKISCVVTGVKRRRRKRAESAPASARWRQILGTQKVTELHWRQWSTPQNDGCAATAIAGLDRLLTNEQVAAKIGISRSTIDRLTRKDLFPPPIRIGERTVRWLESDIIAWLAENKSASRQKENRVERSDNE